MKKIIKKALTASIICCLVITAAFQTSAYTLMEKGQKTAATAKYFLSLDAPGTGSVGGEWMVLGLARCFALSEDFRSSYYETVVNHINETGSEKLDKNKSTENSRIIIALSSIGKDCTNIEGYNLIKPLSDFDFVTYQGLSGPVWALIALDTLNYKIVPDSTVKNQTTRAKLINYILEKQVPNGGWAFFGSATDPDMTGMAIQALAKYYNINDEVKTAVDKALSALSKMQNDNGGFTSWGSENSESCAQIVTALASLNRDSDLESDFIKNGNTLTDNLISFSTENGFSHEVGGAYNQMATEQALYALMSYFRIKDSQTSLYDMSDLDVDMAPDDTNLDGSVNIMDASTIQRHLAKLITLSDLQFENADFDGDGRTTISDVTAVQKYLSGIH